MGQRMYARIAATTGGQWRVDLKTQRQAADPSSFPQRGQTGFGSEAAARMFINDMRWVEVLDWDGALDAEAAYQAAEATTGPVAVIR